MKEIILCVHDESDQYFLSSLSWFPCTIPCYSCTSSPSSLLLFLIRSSFFTSFILQDKDEENNKMNHRLRNLWQEIFSWRESYKYTLLSSSQNEENEERMKNAEWKTRRMSMKRGRRRWKRVEHERQWSSWLKSWANRLWSLEKRCFLSVLFCEWILISRLNKRIMCSFLCVRDTYTHTLVFIVSTDWSSFLAWKTPWNDGHTTK